ncbi:MAG: signal recognition particle-docking protein FtsY [Paludibaculum sp.]
MISLLDRLKQGIQKTRTGLVSKVEDVLLGKKEIDADLLEELEYTLISADIGVRTANEILEGIRQRVDRHLVNDPSELRQLISEHLLGVLEASDRPLNFAAEPPTVVLMVGVNGSGKTTTTGKLAARFSGEGKTVLMCAADTFRAAAIEQLEVWGQRTKSEIIRQSQGADPSAVVFDALQAAKARKNYILLVDTAGRLHTKSNLMTELEKMRRTAGRVIPDAPHEVWLVLDATTGQNGLEQARKFTESLGVTGIILTKLDGTAKGGIVVAITRELNLPIRYVGDEAKRRKTCCRSIRKSSSNPYSKNERSIYARSARPARQGRALATPNPMVGAVFVSEDEVVGHGCHTYAGLQHAEVIALSHAGDRARGATLYINLEPCSHQGRTPPCVDALIQAKIARVVSPLTDPNPLVAGEDPAAARSGDRGGGSAPSSPPRRRSSTSRFCIS